MSDFGRDIRAIRHQLAENGHELTVEDTIALIDECLTMKLSITCNACCDSKFGVCFSCLKQIVEGRPV